ncbi:hypothetical protein F9Z43_09335 [Pseudomonas monteilii]|uniref:Uncharacterized protein n=1 Tax=Pseudomonas monteilii TaxID=76759 RepID=A0A7X3JQY0_9PSED|nr:hypothetical protein [Pseudomonas monteilii]MVF49520.1 hypothetical protein [Pseudomonas monteilii]
MEYELFKNKLRQNREDAASFAKNKETWKAELHTSALGFSDAVIELLSELQAENLLQARAGQATVTWPKDEDCDFFPLSSVHIEFEKTKYFLLPELSGGGSKKPELRYIGSKTLTKEGRQGPALAYHEQQGWLWYEDNRFGDTLSRDSLAKVLFKMQ